jgi:Uma2 family endonuclease
MHEGHRFELIDGRLVERHAGAEASGIAATIIGLLGNRAHAQKRGKVFAPDCGYRIFPDDPNQVRYLDGSFIANGRLPQNKAPRGHLQIAPDLAAEVVSPHDTAVEIEAKRIAFLRAGTKLLWIVYPMTRTVHVYRQTGNLSVLSENDELTGEDVLPGFVCRVAELFADN